MYPRRGAAIHQQQRIRRYAKDTDSYSFFNLLTAPKRNHPVNRIDELLPWNVKL